MMNYIQKYILKKLLGKIYKNYVFVSSDDPIIISVQGCSGTIKPVGDVRVSLPGIKIESSFSHVKVLSEGCGSGGGGEVTLIENSRQ